MLIAVIFATSLHFIIGPGGMHSFGHAAYFGLGAYGAALLVKWLARPWVWRWRSRRSPRRPARCCSAGLRCGLSGVYLAMLTLAFAQIVWSVVFQWEDFTGGSNGVIGVWPAPPFDKRGYFLLDARPVAWSACCCCGDSFRAIRLRHARGARFRRCGRTRSAST